jgi:hypothetical protein
MFKSYMHYALVDETTSDGGDLLTEKSVLGYKFETESEKKLWEGLVLGPRMNSGGKGL